MKLYPMVLTPFVSETVWGGRRLIDEYSVVTDKRNAAEAWVMSAHKNGSSTVATANLRGGLFAKSISNTRSSAAKTAPDSLISRC